MIRDFADSKTDLLLTGGRASNPRRLRHHFSAVTGAIIVAAVFIQTVLSTQRLLTPIDVSGTLFGAAVGTPEHAAHWILAMAGVVLATLLRLPGFRLAWIAAGGAPILFGLLAIGYYPDDANGNLIVSPQRSEIALMVAVGMAFLVAGLILRRYVTLPRPSQPRLLWITLRGLAIAAMAVVFIALPILQ